MRERITAWRVVPVVTVETPQEALGIAGALCEAGLPVMEVTLRTSAALEAIRAVRAERPEMLVGAGTILSPAQVGEVVKAGAQFGLSPGLNPRVVHAARDAGLYFIPGVMTPTEVELALEMGRDLLKFFPASLAGGVGMLRALAGPFAHTGVKFVPLGGVNETNMTEYLAQECVGAVGGSWICERALVGAGDWGAIRLHAERARQRAE